MIEVKVVLTIISVLGTIATIFFGYLAFRKGENQEMKQKGKETGSLASDLGYIKSSIERIEKRLDLSDSKFEVTTTKIAKLEESCHSAHRRVDDIASKGRRVKADE